MFRLNIPSGTRANPHGCLLFKALCSAVPHNLLYILIFTKKNFEAYYFCKNLRTYTVQRNSGTN